MALTALIETVGEHTMLLASASRADESFRPASMSQIVLTGRFGAISLGELGDGNALGLQSCHDLSLFLRGFPYYTTKRARLYRL